jgi:hypothetical protein
LSCYFALPNDCLSSINTTTIPKVHLGFDLRKWSDLHFCNEWFNTSESRDDYRSAAMEYLFSHIRQHFIQRAEFIASNIFNNTKYNTSPANMITVHLRWGDKATEFKGKVLYDIADYVKAVESIIEKHSLSTPVSIWLTTEDSRAVSAFLNATSTKPWRIYYLPSSVGPDDTLHPADMANSTRGLLGLESLMSLLISLESRYYVLTTASNWSRLINELRVNIVNADWGDLYTDVIDLDDSYHW